MKGKFSTYVRDCIMPCAVGTGYSKHYEKFSAMYKRECSNFALKYLVQTVFDYKHSNKGLRNKFVVPIAYKYYQFADWQHKISRLKHSGFLVLTKNQITVAHLSYTYTLAELFWCCTK